jgi:hypothetical protein
VEAAYQRYVTIVRQYGGEPVDIEVFATQLLAEFIEWERLTKSYETPTGAPGRGNYFSLYRRLVRSKFGTKRMSAEEHVLQSYLNEIKRHPASKSWGDPETVAKRQEADIARAKQTQENKKPWRKRSARRTAGQREAEIVPGPFSQPLPRAPLTELQELELRVAQQYAEQGGGALERYVQLLGYNPLERFR